MELKITSEALGSHIVYYDAEDHELIISRHWHLLKIKGRFYCSTNIYKNGINGAQTQIAMHRFLMNPSNGRLIDHIDGNGLNNRRNNLRIATVAQNNYNKSVAKRNVTGFKGVGFYKKRGDYVASIKVNGRSIHGGYFPTKEQAAERYNELAIQHFGSFAKLNIV